MEPIKTFYQNLLATTTRQFPKAHLIAAGALAGCLCISVAVAPSKGTDTVRQSTLAITQPMPNIAPPLVSNTPSLSDNYALAAISGAMPEERSYAPMSGEPAAVINTENAELDTLDWKEFEVKSGDSLSILFQRAGLSDRDLYELFNESPEAKELRHIVPGQKIAFQIDDQGELQQLTYVEDELNSLNFARTEQGFNSKQIERQPDIQISFRQATITSSLFLAGKSAGLNSNVIMELANIFAWDIDFALDIRRNDQFKVMFEERYIDGKKIGTGHILAAEFTNQGKTYKAVRYTDKEGASHYFTPTGESMRKAFLRTPVDFVRISDSFNLRRKHPILHTIRAHKGVDYAAPRGTPIKASGDGKVIYASRRGSFGNTVILQHGQTYQTLYAHMQKFAKGIKSGARVQQGQIIGYIGTTGMSTGPHLHYEFHVNGVVRNPQTVELPNATPIAASEKSNFLAMTQPIVAQLDQFTSASQLAMATSNQDDSQ